MENVAGRLPEWLQRPPWVRSGSRVWSVLACLQATSHGSWKPPLPWVAAAPEAPSERPALALQKSLGGEMLSWTPERQPFSSPDTAPGMPTPGADPPRIPPPGKSTRQSSGQGAAETQAGKPQAAKGHLPCGGGRSSACHVPGHANAPWNPPPALPLSLSPAPAPVPLCLGTSPATLQAASLRAAITKLNVTQRNSHNQSQNSIREASAHPQSPTDSSRRAIDWHIMTRHPMSHYGGLAGRLRCHKIRSAGGEAEAPHATPQPT